MTGEDPVCSLVAVIVTYNPDFTILERLIEKTQSQVNAIVLVDNGEGEKIRAWLERKPHLQATLLVMGENKGIAAAQNTGIAWARKRGAQQVIIFDHDSDPPLGFAGRLQAAFADLEKRGEKVAAVGPRYIDQRWKDKKPLSPFVRFEAGRLRRCYPSNTEPYVAVDFLIASGSLMSMEALDAIGDMKEELFIDYVDIEWGLRARQAAWSLYGVWDAVMEHNLGDAQIKIIGREFVSHSSVRHYYLIRNALWLCRQRGLRVSWRFAIAYNAFKKFIAYSLFMPKPWEHFSMMCRGAWHGLIGRMGRFS